MPEGGDLQWRQAQVAGEQGDREHADAGHVEHLRRPCLRDVPELAQAGIEVVRLVEGDKVLEDFAAGIVDIGLVADGDQLEIRAGGFQGPGVGAIDRVSGGKPFEQDQHHRFAGGGGTWRRGRQVEDIRGGELAFHQAIDRSLDVMALGQVGVAAVHVGIVQDAHGQGVQAVDFLQPARQPGQQRLALGVGGLGADQSGGEQGHEQRRGDIAILPPEQFDIQRHFRFRRVEHAELHQVGAADLEVLGRRPQGIQRLQQVVGVDEGAGGEQ